MDSKGEYEALLDKSNLTGYASASFISKTFWIWLNPLLNKGYKNPLKFEDVPTLSPEHKAEIMSHLFQKNWPKPGENSNHPVAKTLFRCFWQQFAFTAFIALLRLWVLYIGIFLIHEFVDFTSGKSSSPYEGYYLVSILLVAKFVEALSSHQFNFHNEKLAMLIRSALFTSLYKKSLRLSASARQAPPQIVDYMSVDAQQLSDITPHLHSLWLMPLHILVASIILYQFLGITTLASVAVLAFVVIFVLLITKMKSICEFETTTSRGSRLRATIFEMLVYMKAIKFQAWEEHFNQIIHSFRETEYGWLSMFMYSTSANFIVLWSLPTVIATITFGSALLLGFPLTVGTVFSTTSLLKMLQEPIIAFPRSMVSVSQAIISLERLDEFMTSKELLDNTVERFEGCDGDIAVEVKNGSFSWYDEEGKEAVTNLNLEIRKGDLVAIVGEARSGKSNLLAAILGEMNKSSGKLTICGSTAYVAQSLWIRNGTIQENILFGLPMNGERYKEAIRVCSLSKDLEMMEFGDQTEIGPDGIKLSNGQTQRIQLARAVYQDCDIYLLDDVFSAVDAHTRSYIFKECVQGALRGKTVVLVANQVDFLHNFDEILVMREGSIVQSGKYDTLLESGLDFEALVSAHEAFTEVEISEPSKGNSKPIKYEERAAERVSLGVYKLYCESFGWLGVVVLLLLVTWQGSLMSSDYWLAYETSDENTKLFNPLLFISVYAILAGVAFVLILVGCILVAHMGLKTSQIFFGQILLSILHAPASFVNPTSFSMILTRVSFDQTNMDISIPEFMTITLTMCITLISIIIMTCQYAWPTIILVIPLAWLSFWHRGYYISTSRELTRFDAITKARVTDHFLDSIIGITTIRCFKKQELLCNENVNRVNIYLRMGFHNSGSNGWLGFRLELMGSFILCTSALFTTFLPSNIIAPEKVGLALSYGLFLNSTLYWAIQMSCLLEKNMVSLDRLKQFTIIPSEAKWKKEDSLPPSNWPTRGDVEIKNVQVRYSPDTPLVLKGISFSISGGEKIGIVGRSSTEKSALLQVLFRLVEPSGGRIIVDGIDISSLGLHDLRSRFGIIPRDTVLFQGTVRSNIDPTGLFSDDEIWEILERCQLKEFVSSMPGELDAIGNRLLVLFDQLPVLVVV